MPRFLNNLRGFLYKHYDFIMLLAFTLIIFVTKTPIINSSTKLTKNAVKHGPLFPKSSSVVDYSSGDFRKALSQHRHSDILVVYFYAPWDSQCRTLSSVFERVSDFYKDEVSFVAINCWEPTGSCAVEGSLNRYPAIAVYVRGLLPIVYDGPMRADYLTAFVRRAYYPLKVIRSKDYMQYLFSRYDNIVAAYFNFSAGVQPPGFYQFYAASMKLLSRSIASKHTVMAVVLDVNVASELNLNTSGSIGIFKSNHDTLFPIKLRQPWRCSQIWQLLQKPGVLRLPSIAWLLPSGLKSRQLDSALASGPAALLLTRHNPLSSAHHHEAMMREVARLYSACHSSSFLPNAHHSQKAQVADKKALTTWRVACEEWQALLSNMAPPSLPSCATLFASPNANRCSVCGDLTGHGPGLCHGGAPSACFGCTVSPRSVCDAEARRALKTKAEQLWQRVAAVEPAVELPASAADPFIDGMRQRIVSRRCQELELGDELHHKDAHSLMATPNDLNDATLKQIGGQACRTNRSVNFYVFDHGVYPELPSRLGLRTERSPLLVLVDWKNEAVYPFKKTFSYSNIGQFLFDFHAGRLRPSSRDENLPRPSVDAPITDLNLHSAGLLLKDNPHDTVVLYYSPACGFCALFYHLYHLLAQYFSPHKSIVFTRVNVAAIDLPWELRVERLPTIIIYPSIKSQRPPSTLLLNRHRNLNDLVSFVLRSTSSKVFVQSLRHTCSSQCLEANRLRLTEHRDRLQHGLKVSESLLEVALPRLDWLNSKRNGLVQFRLAVGAWDEWRLWAREFDGVTNEFRALLGFVQRRLALVKEYRSKYQRVQLLLKRLTTKPGRLDAVWRNIMGDLKKNEL